MLQVFVVAKFPPASKQPLLRRIGRGSSRQGRVAQSVRPACRQAGRHSGIVKIFFTYIVRSEQDGKFYTGITTNLERRLREHNGSLSGTSSTKQRSGFELVYYELHKSRVEARDREKFWKSGYGRDIRNLLFKKGD